MKTLLVALLLASLTLQIGGVAQATQRAEDGSYVPDSYYNQVDYTPVTQADIEHSQRSHTTSLECTDYYVAYAESGTWGGVAQLDSPQGAINYQHQADALGWDYTLAFTDTYKC